VKIARKNKSHPTKKVIIKTANIDKEMISVVKWLNKFEGVVTKYCCQGGHKFPTAEDPNYVDRPYVVFSCDHSLDLLKIVEKVGYTGEVTIRPPLDIRLMDYCITFSNKENLKMFIKGIKHDI
jgi:hypothetical protein